MSRSPVCIECKHVDFTDRHTRRLPALAPGERAQPPGCSIVGHLHVCTLHSEEVGSFSHVTGDSRRRLPVLCEDINDGSCPDFEEAQTFETTSWLPLGVVLILLAVLAFAVAGTRPPAVSEVDVQRAR